MKNNLILFILPALLIFCPPAFSSPLYSPAWGFRIDLPEGYNYTGGDRKDKFSFANTNGARFDLVVYSSERGKAAPYASVEALAGDIKRRLQSGGDTDRFEYRRKKAVIMELDFSLPGPGGRTLPMSGWALCIELGIPPAETGSRARTGTPANANTPLLLAMAYGPAGKNMDTLHFSALDSLVPEEGDRWALGPVTDFTYPRKTRAQVPLRGLGVSAWIYREDAEAAQALVDREFQILRLYADSPEWKEAWIRFYRAIYRDSFDRLADAAFQVERKINTAAGFAREADIPARDFADAALEWVQSFSYERDLLGSDFVNLVSAATEGRGDCDSRAMLWAIVLRQANIPSAIMVSRNYGHAMGLADLPGTGARFEAEGKQFLVAETTAKVKTGLIGETVSDSTYWLGIMFE